MADRKDEGGGGEPLDKVLSKLDALGTRMDALETGTGHKNPLKGDAAEEDKDKDKDKDDKKGDEFPPKEEDKEKGDKKGDEEDPDKKPPPVAADKKGDAGSAPPAAATAAPDKKGDAEEDKKEDARRDAAIADAVGANKKLERQLEAQAKEILRLTSMMKPRSDDEHAAFADAQSKADSVFMGFGKAAPRPLEGETLLNYRKRLATHLKPHSPLWKGIKFSQLPDEAFTIAEAQVYSDAAVAAATPMDLGDGELREVNRTDPRTGQKTNVFYGRDSFVKGMGRSARRVASFRTQFPN
jgi:hypothetical protein